MPISETALIVLGCGPTGVAALVQAALEGIPAIGIEEGPAPLASILSYMDGLVFTSPACHYEVGGLPLDCKAADCITREDVLRYYSRVINHFGLDIRCNTRCAGLRPRESSVDVLVRTAEGQGVYRAGRALVTSWFERRPLPSDMLAAEHQVTIYSTIENPIQLAGKNVVILGGGISAHEYALRLLLSGQKIVLLSRGEPRPIDQEPRFRGLMAATGSSIWHNAENISISGSTVNYTSKGSQQSVPCDALVAALGSRLREDVLAMLARAGVLSKREVLRLRSARSWEKLRREFPTEDEESLMRHATAEVPDLREHVFQGRQGIHLAGGALHIGSSNAGVMYSMFTAILAVKAMAGHPPPHGAEAPLPVYFSTLNLPQEAPPAVAFERIAPLYPLATSGGIASLMSLDVLETGLGQKLRRSAHRGGSSILLNRDPEVARILKAADGTNSVAGLAERFGMRSLEERTTLCKLLRYLWWNDSLTWMPPIGRGELAASSGGRSGRRADEIASSGRRRRGSARPAHSSCKPAPASIPNRFIYR